MLSPRVIHRSPERKYTEPGDVLENKKVSRELGQPQLQKAEAVSEAGKYVCAWASQAPWYKWVGVLLPQGPVAEGVGWRDLSQKLVRNTQCKTHVTQYPLPGKLLYPFQMFIENFMGRLWVLWMLILNCKWHN